MAIERAFILAAGLGQRMRPLTDDRPKPMVILSGKALIDHALDNLAGNGVKETVVNLHYKGEVLERHLSARSHPKVILSHESALLDTGGGIKKTLKSFGSDPFYVLSGDGFWQDSPNAPALSAMAKAWDPAVMDILILLQPVASMKLTHGVGDYDLDAAGRATRSLEQKGAYMFTSMRINKPSVFDSTPEGPFSYLQILDRAQSQGRLYGLVHQGDWHHISTPQDVAALDAFLLQQKGGR